MIVVWTSLRILSLTRYYTCMESVDLADSRQDRYILFILISGRAAQESVNGKGKVNEASKASDMLFGDLLFTTMGVRIRKPEPRTDVHVFVLG